MSFSLILDLIVIVLLGAVIGYAVFLNRRLMTIQQSRVELQKFMETFTVSLAKAEASVQELKGTGQRTIDAVLEPLNKATAMRDELSFMIEKGESIAEKLEIHIRTARKLTTTSEAKPLVTETSTTPLAPSNDTGPTFQEINPEFILSLKNIR